MYLTGANYKDFSPSCKIFFALSHKISKVYT